MRLLAILALTTACGGTHWHGPIKVANWSEEPQAQRAPVMALGLEDLKAESREPEDAREVLRKSFPEDECKYVTSKIEGSFTKKGKGQVLYSVQSDGCGKGGPGYAVIYEGGSEVRRYEGEATARRAVDLDGDGQDEWVETSSSCRAGCQTEAWVMRAEGATSKAVVHVEVAQEDLCEAEGVTRWTSVEIGADGSERRAEHARPCR